MSERRRNDAFHIERGTVRDFDGLARFHYRGGRPATAAVVYRVVSLRRTVVDRFLNLASASAAPLGVLVVSHPHLSCAMRNAALGGRYLGLDRASAARLVNDEIRTISRVVVDPRCRGLGLATELVRHAIAHCETPYIEAIAAMGRVHPFFEKAGMTRLDPPVSREVARFESALDAVGIDPDMLASACTIDQRLARLDDGMRRWFLDELRRFARSRGRGDRRRPSAVGFEDRIRLARRRLWSRPAYYIASSTGSAHVPAN